MEAINIISIVSPVVAIVALIVALINRKGDRNEETSQWKGKIQQEVDTLMINDTSRELETKKIIAKQAQFSSEIKTLFEKNKEQDEKIFYYSSELKDDFNVLERRIGEIKTEIRADIQNIIEILKNAS